MSEAPGPYHVTRDAGAAVRAQASIRADLRDHARALVAGLDAQQLPAAVLAYLDETGRTLESLTLAELRDLSRSGVGQGTGSLPRGD